MGKIGQFDEWDEHAPRNYSRYLPAMSVDEAISGETQSIYITGVQGRAGMSWRLRNPTDSGQSHYGSLQDAKAAGDRMVEAAYATRCDKIVADAGLDPSEWRFVDTDRVEFRHTDNDVMIVGLAPDQWQLWREKGVPFGNYPTPFMAADAYTSSPAPRL